MVNKFDEIFFDKVTKRLVNIFKGMDWCLNVNCIIVLVGFFFSILVVLVLVNCFLYIYLELYILFRIICM